MNCESGGTVYALVLGTSTERFESSNLSSRTILRRFTMKQTTFENIYNKERFVSRGKRDTKFIDGIEYVKLIKEGTQREVLVRKDFLKKIIN